MDAQKSAFHFAMEFPPDIWAYIVCFLPGEQLGRLKMTGATSFWCKLRRPHVVKSVILGADYLHFKRWPAFLNEFPSLEKLVIHGKDDTWWSDLGIRLDLMPYTLRKLQLKGIGSISFFVGENGEDLHLDKFLPSIEELDLADVLKEGESYSWLKRAPSSLTKLGIPVWKGDVILPASLLKMKAKVVILGKATVINLPPNLESFTCKKMVGLSKLGPALPPTLLSLFFEADISNSTGFTADTLPKSLTSLRMDLESPDYSLKNTRTVSRLPSTLTDLRTLMSFLPPTEWRYLPPSLKRLDCTVPDFIKQFLVDPNGGNKREVLTLPFDELPRGITSLMLWVAQSSPPTLFAPLIEPTNLAYFPPQLTSLSIPNIDPTPELVAHLPSSLTYLETNTICERTCKHLPNGLVTLIAQKSLMSPNLIRFLPKSLTSLNLVCAADSTEWYDYDTGLKVKSITEMPEYAIHSGYGTNIRWDGDCSLPPKLVNLKLVGFDQLSDVFMKQNLPNLDSLMMPFSSLFSDLSISFLHRHLSTLNLRSSSLITGKCFSDLPRSLTWLNLCESSSIVDSDIQHLPRALLELYLDSASELTELCIPDLPRHLQKCTVRANSNIQPSSLPNMPYALRSHQTTIKASIILKTWWSYCGKVQRR